MLTTRQLYLLSFGKNKTKRQNNYNWEREWMNLVPHCLKYWAAQLAEVSGLRDKTRGWSADTESLPSGFNVVY